MSRTLRIAAVLTGFAVLVWLIRRTGVEVIAELLRRVGPTFILVAGLYALHVVLRAGALYACLTDEKTSFREILQVRLTGEAIEMLTFTGPLLAEPAKGFLLKRHGLNTGHAFGAVATEYLLYTFVSACMAVAALSFLLGNDRLPSGLHRPTTALIVGMVVFIAACIAAALTGVGLLVPIIRAGGRVVGTRRSGALLASVEPVEHEMVTFLHTRPARLTSVMLIEVAAHALLVSEIWFVVRALGGPNSFANALVAEGAAKFIGTVFAFVPGQIGASEASYVLIFRSLGLAEGVGLAVALVRRLRALLVAGVSLAIVAMTNDRRR